MDQTIAQRQMSRRPPLASLRRRVSSLDLLNATVSHAGIEVERAVAYGTDPRQAMDFYALPGRRQAPVVVFFHGGAWRTGRREDYAFMGVALARMGFVGVIADYRHFPQTGFPGFVQDAACATGAARDYAPAWGGDPRRLVLFGHSAGAHIAAMVALDPQFLARVGMTRRGIAGWIGLAGPYDFLPMRDPEVREVFGDAVESPLSQPISFADGRAAPALLLHGVDDRVVYPSNTTNLARRIADHGGVAQATILPHTGHIDILLAFAPLFMARGGIAADVAAFVRALP